MDQPTAGGALARLEVLVGTWALEATWPDGTSYAGTASIGWHATRAHLVVEATIDHPDAPDAVSVIGCDGASGRYVQLYSDDRGVCRVYEMTLDDREWVLLREGEPFAQRFVATIDDDGDTLTGRWEAEADGGGFEEDFALVYRRT